MLLYLFSLALLGHGELLNIQGLQVQKHDNYVLIDGPNVENLPSSIGVTDLGDLIARSFWAGQMKDTPQIKLNHQHIPSANLFIANFGADKSILTKENHLQGKSSDLTYDFFPADSVSVLTSMATSQRPIEHGVVGKRWKVDGTPIEAYSVPESFSSKNTYSEMIHNQDSRTNVITSSSNPQLARALIQKTQAFDTVEEDNFQSNNGIEFTKDEALESFRTNEFWNQFSSQLDSLDFSDPAAWSFLMEMEYLRRLGNAMKSNEQPTLYNVATTTPNNPAAQEILLGALSHVQKHFKSQHPEGSSQIVFFKEPTVVSNSNAESKVSAPYQPFELSEQLGFPESSGPVLTDPRQSQICTWLTIFALFIMYYFVYDFMTMDYASDATLFTKWKRGTKIDARMGGMEGMMGDVRF